MANEEIDEELGFFREDFSTESDWEVFNAQLCDQLQMWEISNEWGRELEEGEIFICEWHVEKVILKVLGKEMEICYYCAVLSGDRKETSGLSSMQVDLMSPKNTFGTPIDLRYGDTLHPLARYYGLRRFVVIQPDKFNYDFLAKPDEFSFLLSSVAVVAAEVCSTVPIFVQIYDPKWNFFVGVGLASMLRTNFDLVALEQAPSDCCYLSGLLNMFKEKIPAPYIRPAMVSVRNTYLLEKVNIRIPMRVPFSQMVISEETGDVKLSTTQFFALPSGYFLDSCSKMYVLYTWPAIAENIAIDSALRSDFTPSKAPCGSIFQVVHSTSYLSSCLKDYQKICGATNSLESYVGRNFSGIASAADSSKSFNIVNQSSFSNIEIIRTYTEAEYAELTKKMPGPISENEIKQMLYYIFTNKNQEAVLFPYWKEISNQMLNPHRVKSAPEDSFVLRLSCLLATIFSHFGGKSGLAQFWASFTKNLRMQWDLGVRIEGVAPGFPDTRTCLLHQKLQMLNICIERSGRRKVNDQLFEVDEDNDDDDDNGENFYDCSNDEDENTATATGELKPEGRMIRLGNLKLLDADEPLYVPQTQEPVPKTEDQLNDDAEVMLKLGPGSGLSTQMMCSSLLSDMEAFKAANPKCQLADFIRWHSPNDWEELSDESGVVNGKMSLRMLAPNNTWQNMWTQAKPVPAWRQKRLFDHTNEALKVLHYLETRSIGEIYTLTIISLLHAAILNLKDIIQNANIKDIFSAPIDLLLSDLNQLSQDFEINAQIEHNLNYHTTSIDRLLNQIESLESQLYQFKCFERSQMFSPLCSKFEDVKAQFKEILKNNGYCQFINRKDGEPEGDKIGILNPKFKHEMLDNLISKDYVIRVDGDISSTTKGKTGPQFLRAIVTGEKIRICGAFTENTTFV